MNKCQHTFHRLGGIDDCPDCNPKTDTEKLDVAIKALKFYLQYNPKSRVYEVAKSALDKIDLK